MRAVEVLAIGREGTRYRRDSRHNFVPTEKDISMSKSSLNTKGFNESTHVDGTNDPVSSVWGPWYVSSKVEGTYENVKGVS